VDSRAHTKVTHTLNIEAGSLFLPWNTVLPILHGHFCKSNTNRADITTEHVTTIQSLARPDGIV
jgi:hypothetical protein